MPTGVNLDRYAGSRSCILWHGDNEQLFGPPNLPKLIVSLSLGNSVEFNVRRRAPGEVPSSIRLDHGDLLVMDGSAQSECAHRTVSGLQGLRVNFAYRWVTQHAASCPLAGVVCCVLPTCAQGLVKPSSRWLGEGENKWSSFWGLVLLLLILVFALLVSTWIHTSGGCIVTAVSVHPARRYTSPLGVVPVGSGDGVGDCHDVANLRRERLFVSPWYLFFGGKTRFFPGGLLFYFGILLDMLVAEREPTPCCHDAYSVGTPRWAFFGKGWQNHSKTTASPLFKP